ncbi:hypothetical protein ACWGIR_32020 [Streptomyces albidoflavus]
MFLLSYRPPRGTRIYASGGALRPTADKAAAQVLHVLARRGQNGQAAVAFAHRVRDTVGQDVTHEPTGITFRVDRAHASESATT